MGRCSFAFREKAPASAMAKLALEQAVAPEWIDQVLKSIGNGSVL
ncbi:hypothetical protein [Pseudomonas baetica]|nr:hypothetical protein [Pseudomonas baetica]